MKKFRKWIDRRIMLAIFLDIIAFVAILHFAGPAFDSTLRSADLEKYGLIFLFLLGATYFVLPLSFFGSTLGLALVGLKFVDRDGRNVNVFWYFLLYIATVIPLIFHGEGVYHANNLRLVRRKFKRSDS